MNIGKACGIFKQIESDKYTDIADKFHISVHTVDNHIQKALRLIREGAYKVYTFFFG